MPSLSTGIGIDWGGLPAAWVPLLLFVLRAGDLTLATLRTLSVLRGRRLSSWILGLLQSGFFLLSAAGLLTNLQNPLNLLAYAAGFATGNVLGLSLENRLAPGHSLLRVISPDRSEAVLRGLWDAGWGATELPGRGSSGTVGYILCYVPRRELASVQRSIQQADPDAFVSVQQVRALRGGWRA
jgi:uncharacterized protein YebE (UPF0316 family)